MRRIFKILMIVLMNLWVYPLIGLWTLVGGILAFPGLILWRILFRWPVSKIMRHFIWIYGRGCVYICRPFVRLKFTNWHKDMLPSPGIVVVNHCSFFDAYLLGMLPIFDAHICLRSWPFRMWWYSYFMRTAEYFDWEHSDWNEILADARKATANGRSLIVYPEGHRSRSGQLRRFHSGAFRLSILLDVPIIPLCISGTHTLLPPGRFWFEPATIHLKLLDAVYPADKKSESAHRDFCKQVRRKMGETIAQM